MIRLKNRATGHEVRTDEQSVDFWQAAGYVRQEETAKATPKRTPRKSTTRKSN